MFGQLTVPEVQNKQGRKWRTNPKIFEINFTELKNRSSQRVH